ncbi:MAG: ABC transporter ATP-binding protein [Rectinemataceae bacterium]
MSPISLVKVDKRYRLGRTEASALAGVNLEIRPGERVCLMGPSGSGKSTLLNIIGCVDKPSGGTVLIDGEDTGRLSDNRLSEFRNRTMGFVFQSFNLIPVLSVFENVEYPLLLRRLPAKERRERVEELLAKVGIAEYSRRSPDELSGGQRQRVAIARALVVEPHLVIADEPTASMDHRTGRTIMELMVEMNASAGSTLIFATHDPAVSSFASRIVTLADGRIADDRGNT